MRPTASVRELTTAIARGDPDAFTLFYEQWFARAYSQVRSFAQRDESFCLDVVQETMLKVIWRIKPFDREDLLARWMTRILNTTTIDHLRREARRLRHECAAWARRGADPPGDAGRLAATEERIAWLREQLARLSQEERVLLHQRFGLGKTLAAVGHALGLTGNAAHGRIRRILGRLRRSGGEEKVSHE